MAVVPIRAAWVDGGQAYREGTPYNKNPYPQDSRSFYLWNDAWFEEQADIASRAEEFIMDSHAFLQSLQSEVESIDGVKYSKVCMYGYSQSFVTGFNAEGQQFVSLKFDWE